jgi:hypothetical protein
MHLNGPVSAGLLFSVESTEIDSRDCMDASMFHIADWWLRTVPKIDALAFTEDEYDHLIICQDCFANWWNCVLEGVTAKAT